MLSAGYCDQNVADILNDCEQKHVVFSIRGPDVLDRLQREAPRSVGLWQRALYDFRLK
jgi:hypothetical protein